MNRVFYFLKRNWTKLLVLVLLLSLVVGAVAASQVTTIEDTQQMAYTEGAWETIPAESSTSATVRKLQSGEESTTTGSTSATGSTSSSGRSTSATVRKLQSGEESTTTGSTSKISDTVVGERYRISDGRKVSDGTQSGQDKYLTDPTEAGHPLPIDTENQEVDYSTSFYVSLSIDCNTILDNKEDLAEGLEEFVGDGTILAKTQVKCYDGENVYDVLVRECKSRGINLESSDANPYGSAYIEAINNLGQFDCGSLSGWCYNVDGWYPNYGCSRYVLQEGESIEWRYTCNLGVDLGCTF